jgi:hypothetical protein
MSGGYIRAQREGEHQVVVFTFVGKLDPATVEKWNEAVFEFKQLFDPHLTAITIKGDPTPARFARRGRKAAKSRKKK